MKNFRYQLIAIIILAFFQIIVNNPEENIIEGIDLEKQDNYFYFKTNLKIQTITGEKKNITKQPINIVICTSQLFTWFPYDKMTDQESFISDTPVSNQLISIGSGYVSGNRGNAFIQPIYAYTGENIESETSNLFFTTAYDSVPSFLTNSNFGMLGLSNSLIHKNFLDSLASATHDDGNAQFAFQLKSQIKKPQIYLTKNSFPREIETLIWFKAFSQQWKLAPTQMKIGDDVYKPLTQQLLIEIENPYIYVLESQFNQIKEKLGNSCKQTDSFIVCNLEESEKANLPKIQFKLKSIKGVEQVLTIEPDSYLTKLAEKYYSVQIKAIVSEDESQERTIIMGTPFFYNYFIAFNKKESQIGFNIINA